MSPKTQTRPVNPLAPKAGAEPVRPHSVEITQSRRKPCSNRQGDASVETLGLLAVHRVALGAQKDMQTAIAEMRAGRSYSPGAMFFGDFHSASFWSRIVVRVFHRLMDRIFDHALEEKDGRRGRCPIRQGPSGASAPGLRMTGREGHPCIDKRVGQTGAARPPAPRGRIRLSLRNYAYAALNPLGEAFGGKLRSGRYLKRARSVSAVKSADEATK